jgi:putative protein kinase ArgK-like GTPase of G3E family
VGVSAATGEGMQELFENIQEAREEYETEYKPTIQEKRKQKQEKEKREQDEQLTKLMKDMNVEK